MAPIALTCPRPAAGLAPRPAARWVVLGRPGQRRTPGRPAALPAANFQPAQRSPESVRVPLDYYKLLGVPAVTSRENITRALEK